MNRDTLKIIITELFNLLEESYKNRPLILLLLHTLEALALTGLGTLLVKLQARGIPTIKE